VSVRLFSTLESKLSPHVPGCPLPVMLQYAREAARDVCKRTGAWRYEHDSIPLIAEEYVYPYEIPPQSEVCGVVHSAINEQYIPFVTQEQLHARYPDWPNTDALAQPVVLSQLDVDNFVVAPLPDADTTYTVKLFVLLCPKLDATYMDATVFDEIEGAIVHATLYRLFSLPERSWTNSDLADYHLRQATFTSSGARANANLTSGRAPLSVQMRRFGA